MFSSDRLRIPLEDIVKATNNFADENLIKRGGIADVYKGQFLRRYGNRELMIDVIIRRFHPSSIDTAERNRFLREFKALSELRHRNTVSIFGFCDEDGEMMMIIRYVVSGSLDKYLSDSNLTWSQRLRICLGVAFALRYIHFSIEKHSGFHHDIKSSKILLDEDWVPMLFCFGFRVHNNVVFYKTTIYTEPEYIKSGYGIKICDVYSLGVILFEVLCGRKADESLLSMVEHGKQQVEDMIDPNLRKQMHPQSLSVFSETAYNCLKIREHRPDMRQIVEGLTEALELQLVHEILEKKYAFLRVPLDAIMTATKNFNEIYFVGSQSDCMLYRAELDHFDHKTLLTTEGKNKVVPNTYNIVIIKRIKYRKYEKTIKGFLAEIEMITSCKNPNIVSLLGFSWEGSEMVLIYEDAFISLHEYLQRTSQSTNLTWEKRIHICLDIVHGLKSLYNNMEEKSWLIHQTIHSANVLLDEKWNAKVANFRLSILKPQSFETDNIGASNVYWHSNYSMTHELDWDELYLLEGELTEVTFLSSFTSCTDDFLSDNIYSIGVIFFEILTGRLVNDLVYITETIKELAPIARGHGVQKLKNLVDCRIIEEVQESNFDLRKRAMNDSLDTFSNITYKCLAEISNEHPTLEIVIKSLNKALQFQGQSLEHLAIQYQHILLATRNFDEKCRIGSGGYGEVYKGDLNLFDINSPLATDLKNKDELPLKHNTVAIKRIFSRDDNQGNEGFLTELEVLSRYKHPNIVSLVGFCVEGPEMILVYELASN